MKITQPKLKVKVDISKAQSISVDETVDFLQSKSPKGKRGKYARSWTSKNDGTKSTIYNDGEASLTHILENGHLISNKATKKAGNKSRKRVRPQPHVRPAFKELSKNHIKNVKKYIEIKAK